MIYPLVKEMAAVGAPVRVPVAVACRVLGFSKQGYYKWLKQPVSAREAEERELIAVLHQLHDDDPEGGYRVLADDITEHRTREGKVYLCAIKDVFSNRIVGYSIDSRMKARIAVNALEMAVAHRGRPTGVIVHSDRGSQFRSRRFLKALKRHGLTGSMGRVGASLLTGYSTRDPWWRHADALRVPRRSDARVQHVSHDGQGSPVARAA